MNRLTCICTILICLVAGHCGWPETIKLEDTADAHLNLNMSNPVTVCGKVISESPLKITDGRVEITVRGIVARANDRVAVTGDWDGKTLQCNGKYAVYMGIAGAEVIYIPEGAFLMGNNGDERHSDADEFPQHSVYLSGYWIGKYEVTRGEYRDFIEDGGYSNPAFWSEEGWDWKVACGRTEPLYWRSRQDFGSGTFRQTDKHPVVGVTYFEAEAFCNWAGGHLPTEAQWEKAARWTGSHPRVYPWGHEWDVERCNNRGNSVHTGEQTVPVGSYPTGISPYGLHDMAGNVWEWCRDWHGTNYYSKMPEGGWNDPPGPARESIKGFRQLRGGSWGYSDYDCRSSYRHGDYMPLDHWDQVGFRVAR